MFRHPQRLRRLPPLLLTVFATGIVCDFDAGSDGRPEGATAGDTLGASEGALLGGAGGTMEGAGGAEE